MDLALYEDLVMHPKFLDSNPTDILKSIKNLKHRPDDVLMCSYPKSGAHWVSNMVTLMMTSEQSVETATSIGLPLLELFGERMEKKRSPRFISSHLNYDRLPENHLKNGGKIILLLRNPKDIAVSYFYHLRKDPHIQNGQSWDTYIDGFLKGQVIMGCYFDYLHSWQRVLEEQSKLRVHVIYYEDFNKNCFGELRKLQDYLGMKHSDTRLQKIIYRCSLPNLKADVDSGKTRTLLKDKSGISILYRKGWVGDWKTHFTVEQNETFNRVIKSRLSNSMFTFQYETDVPKPKL